MEEGRYSLSTDGETKLSTNFKVKEFRCKDGSDLIIVDPALVTLLENIRSACGNKKTASAKCVLPL